MSATVIWNKEGTGLHQETVRANIAPMLKSLLRAGLCRRCHRKDCRHGWLLSAEDIRSRLPDAMAVGGCIGDHPTPGGLFDRVRDAHPDDLASNGGPNSAHHATHIVGDWHRRFICFDNETPDVVEAAHELAHALVSDSHTPYDETDGKWYAPHGIRWQRTLAAMGFAEHAKWYARVIAKTDAELHREYDAKWEAA